MEFQEAALTVLREEEKPLHWTVIQDLALKRGYLDPFTQKDIRRNIVRALADAASAGLIRRVSTGVYSLA
ncbi:MAG: winged helix-turn-helix domain-containing protein [Actinomycetota bacterium]|nr:winged helix-turn-helix domain-containing protein [Actinomycetota bacterium]